MQRILPGHRRNGILRHKTFLLASVTKTIALADAIVPERATLSGFN
jgi:hypothetical protein